MSSTRESKRLRAELFQLLGQECFPPAPPLNLRVLWQRTFLEYEEWKVEYDVETAETMPVEAGRRVPAYLLIPRNRPRPMPAIVCLHQCAEDCAVAKEAVVGKAPWVPTSDWTFFRSDGRISVDRSDQAFGYELVHEGFVVLAPDQINCGERNIEAIRKPGENRICHSIIDPHLGQDAIFKRVTDALRAVDVLESLDFVNSNRIGAAGHSMGAGVVLHMMAFDERVQAGVMGSWSGDDSHFYPLIAPRLLLALRGVFDVDSQESADREAQQYAERCYREAEAPENLVIRWHNCGHKFVDEFKWEAYRLLKEHFGILSERSPVSLIEALEEAREVTRTGWEEKCVAFAEVHGADRTVMANRDEIVSALSGLILYLTDRSLELALGGTVTDRDGAACVFFDCTGSPQIPAVPTPAGIDTLRGVRQSLAEHDAQLQWEHSDGRLACRVVFGSTVKTEMIT